MARMFATAIVAVALSLASPAPRWPTSSSPCRTGSNYLPLIVMQSQKLVEKHLAAVR